MSACPPYPFKGTVGTVNGALSIPPGTSVIPSQVSPAPAATALQPAMQACCTGCTPQKSVCQQGGATIPCPAHINGPLAEGCAGTLQAYCAARAPPQAACAPVAGVTPSTCHVLGALDTQAGCALFMEAGAGVLKYPGSADALRTAFCCANPTAMECAALRPAQSPWKNPALSANQTFSQLSQTLSNTYDQAVADAILQHAACWWWPAQGGGGSWRGPARSLQTP